MQELIENLSRDYFNAFSNRDDIALFRMFDENVELIDWEERIQGRGPLLSHNQRFFESVGKITITVELIAVYGLTSFSKLLIDIDGKSLNVVDTITFNNLGKIVKIEAYMR